MRQQLNLASPLPANKPRTVGELEISTEAIAKFASHILTELATGKYDEEVKLTEELLTKIAGGIPAFGAVEKGLEIFLWLNRVTAPGGPIVPDGQGGWVPASNSRFDPGTGRFLP